MALMTDHSCSTPLRVMFVITSMPVGGAETLLVNLVRRVDRQRFDPMICCLKEMEVLGEEISNEIPVFENLIHHKFDIGVIRRLKELFKETRIDTVITVGAGDKMFWGRVAAKSAGVPVILSALHSTGWPDGVGRLNRMLTRITDGFIAVAEKHAQFLVDFEKFPAEKVFMIPNGVDTNRFAFESLNRERWRNVLNIPKDCPVVGIVAALRAEKNHSLFFRTAANILQQMPHAHFVIAGDGPEKQALESLADQLGITKNIRFPGSVIDIPGILSSIDLFALTSHNEAKPVSILEAMSCERPVVATDVGSVSESVIHGKTGFLVPAGDERKMTERWSELLANKELRSTMGTAAREHVIEKSSLDSMTEGYMNLVEQIHARKIPGRSVKNSTSAVDTVVQAGFGNQLTQ